MRLIRFVSIKSPTGNNIGSRNVSIYGMSGNNTAQQQYKYLQPAQETMISSPNSAAKLFIIDAVLKDDPTRASANVDRTP